MSAAVFRHACHLPRDCACCDITCSSSPGSSCARAVCEEAVHSKVSQVLHLGIWVRMEVQRHETSLHCTGADMPLDQTKLLRQLRAFLL